MAAESAGRAETRARLEAERDDLLGMLERLRAEKAAGEMGDQDADALIDDVTARAAEVLRRLQQLDTGDDAASSDARPGATRPTGTAPDASTNRRRSQWVWGAVIVAFVVLAGLLIIQSTGRRGAGDTLTGDTRQTTRDLLVDARQNMAAGEFDAAVATFDEVLAIAPTNAEALTYKAWVGRTMAGKLSDDEALGLLADAVASDGAYADAHVFRAIILRDQGRFDEALAELDAVGAGDIPEFMAGQVTSLRAELTDPDRAAVARAGSLARSGDLTGALRLLDDVLGRNPDDLEALLVKASVLAEVATAATGSDRDVLTTSALDLLVRANRLAPSDPVPLLYRAQLLAALNRNDEARAVLDALDALGPQSAEISNQVASLRSRVGA